MKSHFYEKGLELVEFRFFADKQADIADEQVFYEA
jgi:hypothetical protein